MFEGTLALALGLTLGQLRQQMSAAEFTFWVAYNRVEPIGELRADIRNAMLLQQTHNMHRPKGKTAEKLSSFLPFNREPKKPAQSAQSLGAQIWAALKPKR